MAELAQSYITISDESTYGQGTSTLIPLYVFATEQDKETDSNGTIALGTTKTAANEVLIITSQRDCVEKFGVPNYVTIDGTVDQNNELNEHGLYGLYTALGSTAIAYALRADIDLKQLQATNVEPTSTPENGTLWFDMLDSSYGLFRCNGNSRPSLAWDKIEYVLIPLESQMNNDNTAPLSTFGINGNIALINKENVNTFFEKIANNWYIIGSAEWISAFNTEIGEETPIATFAPHSQTPIGLTAGSIWVKTTEPVNGSNYLLKSYNSTNDYWSEYKMAMYGSYLEAEKTMGSLLEDNTMIVKYDNMVNPSIVKNSIMKFNKVKNEIQGATLFDTIDTALTLTGSLNITSVLNNDEVVSTILVEETDSISMINEKLNKATMNTNVSTMLVEEQTGHRLVITNNNGNVMIFTQSDTAGILEAIGLPINDELANNWTNVEYVASPSTPNSQAQFDTLWFNDELKVDIMVNDNGKWVGYNNRYPTAEIFIQPAQPTNPTDFSLWINSANTEYPTINKWISGSWFLVDITDQTSADGIIFADVRENAGYMSDFSTDMTDMMKSDYVDPNAPNPLTYSNDILLFNTLYSTNNVKRFVNEYENFAHTNPVYTVGNSEQFSSPGTMENPRTERWATASGNNTDGSGIFGTAAQRKMIVDAMAGAIQSNEDLRSKDYDFFFANTCGYPELDTDLLSLNMDKKEMFYIVSDTPKNLAPNGNDIQDWATNANNTDQHGLGGRVLRNAYVTRQYPPMGLTSNLDGADIAVPSSISKMRNLLVLPRGRFAAGTPYGSVRNLASVGYITSEGEYAPIVVKDGLASIITAQSMNPIMPQSGYGLMYWGENTENPITSSLSDEHGIITILRMKREIERAIVPFFFQPNTATLRRDFDNVLRNILTDYVSRDELYDFTLVTDSTVNTPERIGRKELWANIAIEIVKGVEYIYIPIRVVNTGTL